MVKYNLVNNVKSLLTQIFNLHFLIFEFSLLENCLYFGFHQYYFHTVE
jgi:hypothetical protein